MKVKLTSLNWTVDFQHGWVPRRNALIEEFTRDCPNEKEQRRATKCIMQRIDDDNKLYDSAVTRMSVCAPQDQFRKENGRKNSLAKTMHSVYPRSSLDIRRTFWATYFDRKPKPVESPMVVIKQTPEGATVADSIADSIANG